MSLEPFVELYRLCGNPPLGEGAYFGCTVNYLESKSYLQAIADGHLGRVDEIIIDGEDHSENALPDVGDSLEFSIRLPASSAIRFYKNIGDFLKIAKGISRGEMPEEYYIIDLDYYSNDEVDSKPKELEALNRVCRLISCLSDLAHYHDEKLNSGYLKLVFIRPDGAAEFKPIELETRVTEGIIKAAQGLDIRLVEELSQSSASNDPHYSAKVGVFGTSLAEFIGGRRSGDAFDYLAHYWDDFVRGYHRDLSTYLSGFAFHKAKVEVAEAELKIANEFSKVLNDILGKLLGIPVSFAAVLAIQRGDGLAKQLFVVLGILVACWILSRVVANQQRQFKRIESSKDIVIGAMEGKKESYPEDLRVEVDELAKALSENSDFLRKTLRGFWVLSWLPLVAAVGYLLVIHCHEILDCLLRLSAGLRYEQLTIF